jgi:hypothetical protein
MTTSPQQRAAFESFLEGMHTADDDTIAGNLAEDVVLHSPFLAEPVTGRQAVANLLQAVSKLADDLTVQEVLSGENHLAAFFRLQIEDTVVNGVDYARLDADNKIAELSVLWRPLPSMVEMQGHIAPVFGIPALELRTKGA